MAKETTYAGKLGDWRRFLAALDANVTELPHLEMSRAKLTALLNQAVAINADQAARRAAKQEASKELLRLIIDGQRLANFLRKGVQEHYGPRAEKLSEFGLQPFRGLKRKTAPDEPIPDPTTPTPEVHDIQL